MNNEFNFVGANLAKVEEGDAARSEIYDLFSEFKDAIYKACEEQFHVKVSFESPRSMRYGITIFGQSLVGSRMLGSPWGLQTTNISEPKEVINAIEVYAGGMSGVRILRYKINPISGYPVDVMYASKSVECSNKNELLAVIRDAYDLAVLPIRNLCTHS